MTETSEQFENQPASAPATNNVNPAQVSPVQEYDLKSLDWRDLKTGQILNLKIISQNQNGPCPLIALCNVLILRGDITIHSDLSVVKYDFLVELLGDYLLGQSSQFMSPTSVTTPSGSRRRNFTEDQIASYARNLEDVMNLIPTLQFGLDVNVRFDSPYSFELTPSLLVFDIFNVALCHGWVIDPQDRETYQVIAAELGSYNNVVEAVIASEVAESKLGVSGEGDAEKRIRNGIVCKTFLDASASQLTYYGLGLLVETLPPHSLSVLFRNNHFSVVFKKGDNELYTLVTDHGFLNSSQIVWESLQNIENDSYFLDGLFRKYQPTEQQDSMENYPELHQSVLETNAPQGMSDEDFALALSMQEEETARFEQQRMNQQSYQDTYSASHQHVYPSNVQPQAQHHSAQYSNQYSPPLPPREPQKKEKDGCLLM